MKPGQIAVVIKDDKIQYGNVGCEVEIAGECTCLRAGLAVKCVAQENMCGVFHPLLPVPELTRPGDMICCFRSSLIIREKPDDDVTEADLLRRIPDDIAAG